MLTSLVPRTIESGMEALTSSGRPSIPVNSLTGSLPPKHNYSKILLNVGNSDITHHINFNLFSKIIRNLGLHLEGITEQGVFLQKMGIIHRANMLTKNANFNVKAGVYYRLRRLMSRRRRSGMCF